jgi:hypothetical protein
MAPAEAVAIKHLERKRNHHMLTYIKRSVIAAAAVLTVSLAASAAPASASGPWDYLLPPVGTCGTAARAT